MVSYPADDVRSVSHVSSSRRSSSVLSSGASTVRRRHHHHHQSRHGRSHAGGSSSGTSSNEFPIFTHTGDVEIVIAPDPRARRRRDSGGGRAEAAAQRYLLHRLILAQCSGFFEAGMSEEWSRPQAQGQTHPAYTRSALEPPRKRWRYELDWGRGEEDTPMLVQADPSSSLFGADADGRYSRPPPTRPKPQPPPSGFFRSMANFSALNISSHSRSSSRSDAPERPPDMTLQAYDNLFRIFYNYPPSLDAVNIAQAYVECKALLQTADMYDALGVVGPRVDHHLLRFGSRLWRQIAKYPPSYLKLGYLARSRAIFGEATVHVVGNWPACAHQLGYSGALAPRTPPSAIPAGAAQLPDAVFELLEDKVDELEDLKARAEAKLWRLTLTTSRGERVSPANAWTDWLAMSLFRQWLAENTTPPPASILKDSASNARASSRGSTAASSSHNHRPASASTSSTPRHPPIAYNGSVVSASAAVDPRAQSRQPAPTPPFNTGRVFRLIGAGAHTYLAHNELKAFLKLQPDSYDRDRLRRFERRVDDLKNIARDAVKPLMRNFLSLDAVAPGSERDGVALAYLTCVRVGENEFPWEE